MKRFMAVLLLAASVALAGRTDNWNGYGDTAQINNFKADSLKYTAAFSLSGFENLRVDVFFDDTSSAGFASDSAAFIWGIQTGHLSKTSAGTVDTLWNTIRLVADTALGDTLNSLNVVFAPSEVSIAADGTYDDAFRVVDTSTISGWAYQTKDIVPGWDQIFRGWVKGITGNKIGSFVKVKMQFNRREGVKVKQ